MQGSLSQIGCYVACIVNRPTTRSAIDRSSYNNRPHPGCDDHRPRLITARPLLHSWVIRAAVPLNTSS